jgi:uncharacterized membrane-anchored protein YitT (DUF2179 family)
MCWQKGGKMKTTFRIILLIIAIAIGGLLGSYLLVGYEIPKMLLFLASCIVLGQLFHIVDTKIMGKK